MGKAVVGDPIEKRTRNVDGTKAEVRPKPAGTKAAGGRPARTQVLPAVVDGTAPETLPGGYRVVFTCTSSPETPTEEQGS